jgi:Methyltransferase domain
VGGPRIIRAVLVDVFEGEQWQMSLGERAAVEGVLTQVKPALAIEIGTAQGVCLQRIAAHSEEVHSFDYAPPTLPVPDNATIHTGDSHELLPPLLAGLAAEGRNVDFVIVDGDHSAEGVRRDIEDLLNSPAVGRSVILIHDIANERVRAGVDAVHYAAWPKVAHVELDWIPGQLFAEPELRDELWFGLGLVIVDVTRPAYMNGAIFEDRYYPAAPLLADARDMMLTRRYPVPDVAAAEQRVQALAGELRARQDELADAYRQLAEATERIARADRVMREMKSSLSWKVTKPLRATKQRLRSARSG